MINNRESGNRAFVMSEVHPAIASALVSEPPGDPMTALAPADERRFREMVAANLDLQEELSDQLRARALMDSVLSAMPSELREVFVLFELEELAVAEVAELLSIPIGTVGSRLRRAREDFHERVRRLRAAGLHRGQG